MIEYVVTVDTFNGRTEYISHTPGPARDYARAVMDREMVSGGATVQQFVREVNHGK